ncbi:hypothetical protein ACHAWX_006246 [Stephanocyclus meneghinianus]
MAPTVQTLIQNPEASLQPPIMSQVASDGSNGIVSSNSEISPLNVTQTATKQYATPMRLKLKNTVTPSTVGGTPGGEQKNETVAISSNLNEGKADASGPASTAKAAEADPEQLAPSINLAPRLAGKGASPAARAVSLMPRKSPSDASSKENIGGEATQSANNTCAVKPRNLGSALKRGNVSKFQTEDGVTSSATASLKSAPSTKSTASLKNSLETPTIPPPSQFLAAKISPLRSSARIKKRDSPRPSSELVEPPPPSRSPLPDIARAELLSPCGMFLTPRTPKLSSAGEVRSTAASSCLTPSNFANDFGKGGPTEGIDASGVFAWLHSPTLLSSNGLFSPNGGLAQSLTNTPRGMYGFSGKTPYTPSTMNLAPSQHSSTFFFSEAEGLPDREDKNNSMICISPLASQRKAPIPTQTPNPSDTVLSTPMSIDFNKVFATPRLPTPRLSKTAGSALKKDIQTPVLSSLERSLIEDEDLNAMLQLAEATPSGTGRSMGFMSPLLTNSLRRVVGGSKSEPDETLSDLQLPIISGRSIGNGSRFSPQLAVRSSSNASTIESPKRKAKPNKKRKAGDVPQSQVHDYPPQRLSYPQPPHPSMLHYPHQGGPSLQGPGYYSHPCHPPPPNQSSHQNRGHHNGAYPPHASAQQHYSFERKGPLTSSDSHPDDKSTRQAAKTAKAVIKKAVADDASYTLVPPKKKARKSPNNTTRKPKSKNVAPEDPEERERVASAIRAVNASSGGNNNTATKLAAELIRGLRRGLQENL